MSTGDGSAAACDRLRKRVKELELEVSRLTLNNSVKSDPGITKDQPEPGPDGQIDMVAVLSSGGVISV